MEKNISPIDNRYSNICDNLREYVSDYGINKIRFEIEIKYLRFLLKLLFNYKFDISSFINMFSLEKIRNYEKETNHDIKAIEYYIKNILQLDFNFNDKYCEFVHFGLTSQDINSLTNTLSIKYSLENTILPKLEMILTNIQDKFEKWKHISMMSRTHGQPAVTTSMGKEFMVYYSRLQNQITSLNNIKYTTKFGGAVGNLSAHYFCYEDINWEEEMDKFLDTEYNVGRNKFTTQVDHYDNLSEIFDIIRRINVILLDFNTDMWLYISQNYFKLKLKENEVGSSTMPHKVNPINFENSEGNLHLANALLNMFSNKLPISRLQRDLTDSTISRNFGTALSYCLIAYSSLEKGLDKLEINEDAINFDLQENWSILMEAVQSKMKTEFIKDSYEKIKNISRGKRITKDEYINIVEQLDIKDKSRLLELTPFTY